MEIDAQRDTKDCRMQQRRVKINEFMIEILIKISIGFSCLLNYFLHFFFFCTKHLYLNWAPEEKKKRYF